MGSPWGTVRVVINCVNIECLCIGQTINLAGATALQQPLGWVALLVFPRWIRDSRAVLLDRSTCARRSLAQHGACIGAESLGYIFIYIYNSSLSVETRHSAGSVSLKKNQWCRGVDKEEGRESSSLVSRLEWTRFEGVPGWKSSRDRIGSA